MTRRAAVSWLGLVLTYIGAVIGAGFASGQEIVTFFTRYGLKGLAGVGLATMLFVISTYLILTISRRERITRFADLACHVCGPWLGQALNLVMAVALLGSLGVMLAGSGAILQDTLQIPYGGAVVLTALAVAAMLLYDLKGISATSSILVPCLIAVTVLISIRVVVTGPSQSALSLPATPWPWWWSAILYVSLNIGLGAVVLAAGAQETTAFLRIALVGGGSLGVLAGSLWAATYHRLADSLNAEIPVLVLAASLSPGWKVVYAVGFWLAVITTAVACAYGSLQIIASWFGRSGLISLLGILVLATSITRIGFAQLIRWLYPAYGYGCLIFLVMLLIYPIRLAFRRLTL